MSKYGAIVSAAALLLGGCALQQSTPKIAIDYNRDFAKSRNEMLLLNILRAAAREPLQFSTMGTVSGAVGNGSELLLPFTNLIGGGSNVISPSLKFTDAINPTITITPLTSKDFATGILSPIRTDTLQLFVHNGWDAEFLLPVVVGAVICPDNKAWLNSGEYLAPDGQGPSEMYSAFKEFFQKFAKSFSLGRSQERTLTLGDKDLLDALKNGLGANLVVVDVTPVGPADAGKSKVTLLDTSQPAVRGDPKVIAEFCRKATEIRQRENREREAKGMPALSDLIVPKGREDDVLASFAVEDVDKAPGSLETDPRIVFRSVGSVIQFLGESHRVRFREGAHDAYGLTYRNRDGRDQILFRIGWGLDSNADMVSTVFQGVTFRIPRIDLRLEDGGDRTLKTLSFLDQLIALQTSESVIRGTQPILTIAQ